jgi:hypothetical protein
MIKKGKNPTPPPYPRTDRQVVRTPANIGPNALSNRQPLDNNVKDRGPDEKICEILSKFTMSINNKPSGNRQKASAIRQFRPGAVQGPKPNAQSRNADKHQAQ